MTIHRGKLPNDHFTMVPNLWVRDSSLPWAARGLLVWLMSHAVGYKITENLICASGPASRDAVRTMIHALEEAGYLKRVRTSQPTGGSTVDYLLQDPGNGYTDSLDVDLSDSGPEQPEQDLSAAQASGGESDPRSSSEEQKKTKTPSVSKQRTATRIPDNFQPDEKMRAWFAAEKLGQVIDGRLEHDQFVDFWTAEAGPRARKLDWPATWRRWMRKAASHASSRRPYGAPGTTIMPAGGPMHPILHKPSTTDARISQGMALAAKYEEQGL